MKFRKFSAVFAAVAVALSFGGCLRYSGDLLQLTVSGENDATSGQDSEQRYTVEYPNATLAAESQTASDVLGTSADFSTTGTTGNTVSEPVNDATAAGADSQTSQPNDVTASNAQDTPSTTVASNASATTVASSQTQSDASTVSGLDVLKSGNFYWKGRMQDETGVVTPTEMASTKDSLYMSTNLNGADVAMLIKGGTTYIVYPKIKGYMNMKLLMTASGMDADMFDTSALDFSSIGSLSEATSQKNTQFDGKDCVGYAFTESGATTEIFMSGNSFLGMRSTDSSGNTLSVMYVDYLTGTVPDDKSGLPADYTEYSGLKAISFMTELAKDMDIDTEN